MTVEERIRKAETHISKMGFPELLNHHHTMVGGKAIAVMTEAGFITATRFSHDTFVIVSCEQVAFLLPVPGGMMIDIVGTIECVGRTSVTVAVRLFLENMHSGEKQLAAHGLFKFVAIGADKKAVPLTLT